MYGISRRILVGAVGILIAGSGIILAIGGASGADTLPEGSNNSSSSLTVAVNTGYGHYYSLDPAMGSVTGVATPFLEAVFGTLFDQGAKGQVVPDLATGYDLTNGGRTLIINLRHGVKFSDGTPFNAAAVAYNIHRDLTPQYGCVCHITFPISSVTTPNNYTVDLSLSEPDSQIIYAFFSLDSAPNYIGSPTALQTMSQAAFALKPVGAGPFVVVSDEPGTMLSLKRNPLYWHHGHPYLSSLNFIVTGTDQSSYDALLTGQAQAYLGYGSISELKSIESQHRVHVTFEPAFYGPSMIALNARTAPFNNRLAREAIYYATDPKPINRALNGNLGEAAESPTIRGGLYYEAHVPGYRTYNLAKAKSLVKRLGGLSFTIMGSATATQENVIEALKSEWVQAGMNVKLGPPLAPLQTVQDLRSGNWEASLEGAGGFDPVFGTGLEFWYESNGQYSVVDDPVMDNLIAEGQKTVNVSQQDKIYRTLWKHISDEAYTPFLYATPMINMSLPSVSAPGLTTTGYEIFWADARVSRGS